LAGSDEDETSKEKFFHSALLKHNCPALCAGQLYGKLVCDCFSKLIAAYSS